MSQLFCIYHCILWVIRYTPKLVHKSYLYLFLILLSLVTSLNHLNIYISTHFSHYFRFYYSLSKIPFYCNEIHLSHKKTGFFFPYMHDLAAYIKLRSLNLRRSSLAKILQIHNPFILSNFNTIFCNLLRYLWPIAIGSMYCFPWSKSHKTSNLWQIFFFHSRGIRAKYPLLKT